MSRLQLGIVRYASVAAAIEREFALDATPDCRIGHGRLYITFRSLGGARWPADRQADHALRAAGVARAVLAGDRRAVVRRRAGRAIVVVYEDAMLVRGCAATARCEYVIPAAVESPGT